MLLKSKIKIATLVLGAFVAGGFALNTFQADAFSWGKWLNRDSEEWQVKMEEFKAMTPGERGESREECRAVMEELRNSTEWQEVTQEERREMMKEITEENDCLFPGFKFGHFRGLRFGQFGDEVNHEVTILDNGIQITITSDNPEVVEKLHNFPERIKNINE